MERKNKVFLVHLSSLKTKGLFSSTDKKEERAKEQERCCKAVLSWFGRRMGAFDIHYSLIGIFCEGKSVYMDKINMLIDRFDIGAVFIGHPDLPIHEKQLRANIFKINRRMGFVWDKSFLKQSIHNADVTQLKSYDESTGLSGYEAKLETDYVEYRFLVPPQYNEFEKSVIVAETCGQPVPMAAKEELIRMTSDVLHEEERKISRPHSREALKEEKVREHAARKESLHDVYGRRRESEREREREIPIEHEMPRDTLVQQQLPEQLPISSQQQPFSSQQVPISSQQVPISSQQQEWTQGNLPEPLEAKKASQLQEQQGTQRDVSV
jgi:hypothetical protein